MIKQIILMMILLSVLVTAYNPADKLTDLESGKNLTISMKEYTRNYVKIREGSAVQFCTYDAQNNILAYNTIIIKEITQEKTKALLSIRGRKYEEIELRLGNDYKINFTGDKKIPFMFIKEDILHYDENPNERNIILLFNVPQFRRETLPEIEPITRDNIEGAGQKKELFTPLRVIFLILIIGIITALIILFKKDKLN